METYRTGMSAPGCQRELAAYEQAIIAETYAQLAQDDKKAKRRCFKKKKEQFFPKPAAGEEDHDELWRAGIDPEKLEYLRTADRRRILVSAGLDPDEYDF